MKYLINNINQNQLFNKIKLNLRNNIKIIRYILVIK